MPNDDRLDVNITGSTADAIRDYAKAQNVTVTEAARRLISYGNLIAKADQLGRKVLIKDSNDVDQVVFLHD